MTDIKFLRQVAAYFSSRSTIDNMAELVMVVPNRRSGLFLKKHFQRELAGRERPVMLPRFHTIGRLVQDFAQCPCMPRNEQLFLLYEAYCEVLSEMGGQQQAREFDRFAFWGDIIINDFNDIDSSLADASAVFRNLKGMKEIAADFLTNDQKEIVRKLWGDSIYTRSGSDSFWLHLENSSGQSVMKSSFIQLWQLLGPLYMRFHKKLHRLGLCTEGLQQRMAVEAARSGRAIRRRYAFVGFSTVTKAEFALMDTLRKKGAATFFWDFGMLPAEGSLSTILRAFGGLAKALPAPDDFVLVPAEWPEKIECIAVPSNNGQAKYLAGALRQWNNSYKQQGNAGVPEDTMLDTAVVVPDESILSTLVLSLPHEVEAVNITLRLPYRSTTFASLLSGIISMQLRARLIHGEFHFFFEDVERILSHPHLRTIAGEKASSVLRKISARKMYNVAASDLQQMLQEFGGLFRPVKNLGDIGEIHSFTIEMIYVLEDAFRNLAHNTELIEFRMLTYFRDQLNELFRLIMKYGVSMSENTYFTLFERLLSAKRIDLHGSPLKGLQVMGVLETRALDFNRVIIMSMNERIFPRRSYLRTMIPDNLRRDYGLNTESEADAAYTYYFYRMITGARNVKLLYDNRPASLGAGEVSRYISQLKHLHSHKNVVFSSMELASASDSSREISVCKDDKVMSLLNEFKAGGSRNLSASALKTYFSCPLKFYLEKVRRLSTDDEVKPYLNAADYGTVVHSVMEHIYKPYEGQYITRIIINSILNAPGFIMNAVQKVMSDFLNRDRIKRGKAPLPMNTESQILCRVIHHFVVNVLKNERDTYCAPSFRYICAERKVVSSWKIDDNLSINFKMLIDRIDEVRPGKLRFIDYKTGGDATSAPNIGSLFTNYRCSAIFQLLLYAEAYKTMVDENTDIEPVVYNFTSITANGRIDPITIASKPVTSYDQTMRDNYVGQLKEIIRQIFDPETPFEQCKYSPFGCPCSYCSFADLCGR